jgi:Zn-dependent protease
MTRSVSRCEQCGTELSPAILACPACRGLVHRGELTRLAEEAEQASRAGDRAAALAAWRQALTLLPPGSRQHAELTARVRDQSREVDRAPAAKPAPNPAGSTSKTGVAGAVTMIGLLLWKLKFVAGFLLAQGKLLLLGLTKISTLASMLLSLGVYWTAYGYKFALGLLLSMYVHEMGHVAALRRYGIAAGAPMFVPGFGAFVRLKQYPIEPREDARVGLAGPIWGLAAALVAYGVGRVAGFPSWLAIARVGAWINLFNLVPVWQLDGGRGFRALTGRQRLWATAAIGVAWLLTLEGMLLLLLVGALVRVAQKDKPAEPDRRTLVEYVLLVAALSALSATHIPEMPAANH